MEPRTIGPAVAHDRSGEISMSGRRARFVRFPPEVITLAVRWYLRFGLSYRDVEELLAERGIEVDHVSVYRPRSAAAGSPSPKSPTNPETLH